MLLMGSLTTAYGFFNHCALYQADKWIQNACWTR